jgi:hypothetical protein
MSNVTRRQLRRRPPVQSSRRPIALGWSVPLGLGASALMCLVLGTYMTGLATLHIDPCGKNYHPACEGLPLYGLFWMIVAGQSIVPMAASAWLAYREWRSAGRQPQARRRLRVAAAMLPLSVALMLWGQVGRTQMWLLRENPCPTPNSETCRNLHAFLQRCTSLQILGGAVLLVAFALILRTARNLDAP